ncbi:transposase [Plakobranchus ocellatus]|uniref:Transposase n=1 Tax=Plakobranchus ocellatus TaxID=259542 RepID=A0AAV3YTW2_9GAST|nr:transposase [Plakobranchus ocellatus]
MRQTTLHNPPKVHAQRGSKQVGQVTSQGMGELVTLREIVCAAGTYAPSVLIFPRKKENKIFSRDTPAGTLGLTHEYASGWMNGYLLLTALEHFVKHSRA